MPNRDGGYRLPAIIEPDATKCVRFFIPDEQMHRIAFWGAVGELGYWWNWERDEDKRGAAVARVWRAVIEDAKTSECEECDDDDDEDTLQDAYEALMDGVLENTIIGGITRAIGTALEDAGRIITETILPVVGITLVGLAVGALAAVIVGGVTVGTVAVAAGETVEILVATGASVAESKIIELVALAAAA